MKNKNPFNIFFPLSLDKIENLEKIKKNCSSIQYAWLSGYFWNLANQTPSRLICEKNEFFRKDNEEKIITIISASQTGNARQLAKRFNKYLKNENKKTNLIDAADYNFKKIKNERFLILIISTQGEGEPPEEALSFYKFIMSKKAPRLENLHYSVFGLGDVSYNLFCQAGKDFDKRFSELGGKSLLHRLDSDIEYESNYIQWSEELLLAINKIDVSTCSVFKKNDKKNFIDKLNYTKYKPAVATVLLNQKITGRNSTKDVHHIELDITNSNIVYTPGDALGVWYQNSSQLIKQILKLLSIRISDKVKVKDKIITIFEALKKNFELTTNTKHIIQKYTDVTQNKFLKKIISDNKKLNNYVKKTPLLKMIYDHPKKLSSQQLISILRPLKPRLYSISSSQSEMNDEVHITVGVVKKQISGTIHLGGSSSYLSQFLKIDDSVKIFVEEKSNFRLPENKDVPIIMIGSGTGIAPFRAFIQQRDNDKATGKNWIFFGNPNFTEDFLYQLEWQKYLKKKLLTKMSLAWSRDQKEKIYVQDKIRENGKELWEWVNQGAQIYVCGNASKMAKDVEKELLDVFSKNGSMDIEESSEFLNNLRITRRYQRDVY
ncbi:assimilatory sulfite reductase (NADPH) flavoprotein subunit [Buchnera aphidicola]|jgi:sulfite reductase (NADPH) flavoprotein alpha-component|uniref:Sulfite reductase [NADPH] flavoprotein alpha-component n=1 Tax=Buchnera aphidicola subsp. Schizaphis graminum (strain Sg) TaxID=198804 RepID=CYSJ_BUCAP|nr:assimilatory sulfite reductase (NADPH) flavoprotein subunit [Buchnera aphidicola]Q8K9D3.1 RecName: Full=Sulfite reductase [NADPH] flavoprotein alpha-component; Short=SiR-FP [Buchnera aphidicola str. Sg (Schizaphis graminum)]AAM67958.1 sulfite reductase [NADPH] flavoprotein alpha [Buchnera aphidicola str. Sg (Schizaphis graminum)]AWI49549.1 assimilatory sulfite reductase (NADPH) flavoprotein subunit [Buchnera aphidicola (Schizaphis graminum)]